MKEILYAVLVLGIMGAVFGAVLAIASKVFAVKTDERLPKLVEALPGANCGGCGFAGCQAYAQAVLEGRAEIGLCVAGGQASADRMAAVMAATFFSIWVSSPRMTSYWVPYQRTMRLMSLTSMLATWTRISLASSCFRIPRTVLSRWAGWMRLG